MEIYYHKPCCQVGPNVDIMIGTTLVITQLALRMIFLHGQTKGRFGKRYLPRTESRLRTTQSTVLAGIESFLEFYDDLLLSNTQCPSDNTVNKAHDVIGNFCPLRNDEYNESNQRLSYYQREEAGYGKDMPQRKVHNKQKESSLNLRKYESRQRVQTSHQPRFQRTVTSHPGTSGNQAMSSKGRAPSRFAKGRVDAKATERRRSKLPVKTIGAVRMVHLHRDGFETDSDSNETSATTGEEDIISVSASRSSSTGRLVKASIAAAATLITALKPSRTSVQTLPMSSSENESIRRLVRPSPAHQVHSRTKQKLSSAFEAVEPIQSNVKHKTVLIPKLPLPIETNKVSTEEEEEEEETERRSIIIHDKPEFLDKELSAPTTSTGIHGIHGIPDTKWQPTALTLSSSNEQRFRKSGMISEESINAKKLSFNEKSQVGKESVSSYKPLEQYLSNDSKMRQSVQSAKSFMSVAQTDARLSADKQVKESTSSVLEVTDNENKILDKTSINQLPFSPRSDIILTPGCDSIDDRHACFSSFTDGTITPEVRVYHPQGGGGSLLPSDDLPYDELVNGAMRRQNRIFYNKFFTTNDESTLKSSVESLSSSIDSDKNSVTVTQSAKSSLMYSHTGDSALTLTQTDESLLSFEGGSNSFFSVQESGLSVFSADQSNLTTEKSCSRSFSLGNSGIYFRTGEAFDGEGIMRSTQNRKPYTTEERSLNEKENRKCNSPVSKPGKTISSIDQRANAPDDNQFAPNRLCREEDSKYQQQPGFYFTTKRSQDFLLGAESDRKSHIPRQTTPENDDYKQQRKVNETKYNIGKTCENDEYKQQRKVNEFKYNNVTTFENDVYKQQRKMNEYKYNNTTTLENDEYKQQRKMNETKYNSAAENDEYKKQRKSNELKYNTCTTPENDEYKQRKANEIKYNNATTSESQQRIINAATPSTSADFNYEKNKSLKKTSKEKASDFEIEFKLKRGFPLTAPGIPSDIGLRSSVLGPFSVPEDKISNNTQFSTTSPARERGRHSFPESAPSPDRQAGRFSLPEPSSKSKQSDSNIMGTRLGTYKEPFPKLNAEKIEPNGARTSSASTEPSFIRKDLQAVPGYPRTDSTTSFRRNSIRPFPWIPSTTSNGLTGQTLQPATNSRTEPEANRNKVELDKPNVSRVSGLEEQSGSRTEAEATSVQSSRVGLSLLDKLKPFLGKGSEIPQTGSGPISLDSDVHRISPESTGLSTRVGLALLSATSIDPFPKRDSKSSSDSCSLSGTGSGSLVLDPVARRRYSTDREINGVNGRFSGLDVLSRSNIKLYFDTRSKTSNSSNSDSKVCEKSLSKLVQSMGISANVSGLKLPPSGNVSFSSKENGSNMLPEAQSIGTVSNILGPDSNQTSSLSGSHGSENEKEQTSKRISKKQKLKRIPISNLSIGSDTGLIPRDLSQIASIIVSSAGETFANRLESSIWTPSGIGLILDSQDQVVSSETSIRTGQKVSESRLFEPEDYGLLNQEALVPVHLRPERTVLSKNKSRSQTDLALTTSLKTSEKQQDNKKKDRTPRDDESSTSKVTLRKTSIKQSKSATDAKKDDLTDEPSASNGKKIISKRKSDSVGNLYSDETQSEPSIGKSSGDESTCSSEKTIKAQEKFDSSLKQNVSTKDVPESSSREPVPVTGQNKSGSEGFLKRRLRSSLSFGLGFLFESTTFIPSVPPMRTLIQAPRTFFSNRRLNRRVISAAGSTNQMETAVEETEKLPWMTTRFCDSSDSDDSLF